MKNFAGGKMLVWALLFWLPSLGQAEERFGWLFEQLADPPEPTHAEQKRHQIGLDVAHLEDAFSSRIQGLLDLGLIELNLSAAQRAQLFPSAASQLSLDLADQERVFGFQLARYAINDLGYFGRLGLGYFVTAPNARFSRLNLIISTGFVPSERIPWAFRLHMRAFFSPYNKNHVAGVEVENLRQFNLGLKNFLRLGGLFSFNYRIPTNPPPLGASEYMLFSFGPSAQWEGNLGNLQLSVRWRMWVDVNYTENGSVTQTTNPIDLRGMPDFFLRWRALL